MEQDFGERLKNYRKAKGLTQRELAEAIGVSDKTVSRWESGGGWPDVPVLVPLARALGVTVDDLLDSGRPVRTLTRTDWQNLLSFAFALGGGVLFFLLDTFMPALLAYLAYLVCLAYGVYLQKYYAYQSRWFLLGEAVVNLSVNLSAVGALGSALSAATVSVTMDNQYELMVRLLWWLVRHIRLVLLLGTLLALAATAVTQYLVLKKGFDGAIPGREKGKGKGRLPLPGWRLGLERPSWRLLPAGLVPLLAGLFWLPGLWEELVATAPGLAMPERQTSLFLLWLVILAVLATLPLLKRKYRRYILPAWFLAALCWGMTGMRRYWVLSAASGRMVKDWSGTAAVGARVSWGTWGTAVWALGLAAVWLLSACLRLRRKEEEPPDAL